MDANGPQGTLARFFEHTQARRIGVAVSGGSDSLALLHLVCNWALTHGVKVHAATVDHGLRSEAPSEAAYVAQICEGLGVSHTILCWTDWDKSGNLQAEARAARYRLLADWAKSRNLESVLLGHTMDDQAETLLMRLARGAGVDGLSAMAARFTRAGQTFGRPLLDVRRQDLRKFLNARDVAWIDDPSNTDPAYDRVRVRAALATLGEIGLDAPVLSRVSQNLAESRDALRWQVAQIAKDTVTTDRGDIIVSLSDITAYPDEILRRLMSEALMWVSGASYVPRGRAMTRLVAALRAGRGETLHGCLVRVSHGKCRISREWAAVARVVSCGPMDQEIVWDRRWHVTGPWQEGLQVRALSEQGILQVPDWRNCGLPRQSLLASPSVWYGETLVSAPLAGWEQGWRAEISPERANFLS